MDDMSIALSAVIREAIDLVYLSFIQKIDFYDLIAQKM